MAIRASIIIDNPCSQTHLLQCDTCMRKTVRFTGRWYEHGLLIGQYGIGAPAGQPTESKSCMSIIRLGCLMPPSSWRNISRRVWHSLRSAFHLSCALSYDRRPSRRFTMLGRCIRELSLASYKIRRNIRSCSTDAVRTTDGDASELLVDVYILVLRAVIDRLRLF